MKPVGSAVHLKRGTVRLDLVKWLALGSVPTAFLGVVIAKHSATAPTCRTLIQKALGVALVIAAAGLFVRAYMRLAERARERDGRAEPLPQGRPTLHVRPLQTVLIGAVGGLVVGLTSVGSGSLIIIALMMLYPRAQGQRTGRHRPRPGRSTRGRGGVRAHPVRRLQPRADRVPARRVHPRHVHRRTDVGPMPGGIIRRALAFILLASALKLFGVSSKDTAIVLVADARPGGADLDGDPSPARLPRARTQRTPNRSRIRAGRTLAGRTRARCEQPRRGGGCAAKGTDGMIVRRD